MKERLEALKMAVEAGLENGARRMMVDLDLLASLFDLPLPPEPAWKKVVVSWNGSGWSGVILGPRPPSLLASRVVHKTKAQVYREFGIEPPPQVGVLALCHKCGCEIDNLSPGFGLDAEHRFVCRPCADAHGIELIARAK